MNRVIIFLSIFIYAFVLFAELVNNNPDPNGEPWFSADLPELTITQQKNIDVIPKLHLPDSYKISKYTLPYTLDNSLQPYFRPVFLQQGGSCGQASGVGYLYTYEQNFSRGTYANTPENQYPTHYTYNFLNHGSGTWGSWYFDGWNIIASSGCPNVTDYGGMLWPSLDPDLMFKIWMSGYDHYDNSMNNRVLEQIEMPIGTPEGLEVLKQWMNDHCDGSATGGIAVFTAGVSGTYERVKLPLDSYCPDEPVIIRWDRAVNHAMTFVGYNDSIRWDYNNDGKYTNDIDITGDGIVDMQDWEIGGLRMVNSWGTSWADEGKSWVMYRTLAQDLYNGGIYNNTCHSIKIRENVEPKLKLKATISCSDRDNIMITAGISQEPNAFEPRYSIGFPHFNYQGGDLTGMSGDSNTIELGLDISPLLSLIPEGEGGTVFLSVTHNYDSLEIGEIKSLSIFDSDGDEFVCENSNVQILNNATTHIGVVLPQPFKITTEFLPPAIQNESYSNILTLEKGVPPYSWDVVFNYQEIENLNSFPQETMTQLTMSEKDNGFATLDLDFEFPYFDNLYNTLKVTTDGVITFKDIYESVTTIEDLQNTKCIAPCLSDFDNQNDGSVSYFSNNDYAIIVWNTSTTGSGGSSGGGSGNGGGGGGTPSTSYFNFAVKLYPDGTIEYFYGADVTAGKYLPSGFSNGTASSTVISKIFAYSWDPSGLKTSFSTNSYPYGVELSSNGILSGTVLPTDETEWNLIFRATDSNNLVAVKELAFSVVDFIATLSPPQNITTNVNLNSNIINWDQVQGATLYNIYRSTDPYSGFIKIGTSNTLSYSDNDILLGSKYFYYITADNSIKN